MEHFYYWGKVLNQNCRIFCSTWVLLNRRDELCRLKRWASFKKLAIPLHLYKNRLEETEKWLLRASFDAPKVARYVSWIHRLKPLLIRPPKFYAKGSARAYKRGWLTV